MVDNSTNYNQVFKKPPDKNFLLYVKDSGCTFPSFDNNKPEDHDKLYLEFQAVRTMSNSLLCPRPIQLCFDQ